jgi:hypothetical protein
VKQNTLHESVHHGQVTDRRIEQLIENGNLVRFSIRSQDDIAVNDISNSTLLDAKMYLPTAMDLRTDPEPSAMPLGRADLLRARHRRSS